MTCLVEYRSDGSVRQYWPLEKNRKYIIGRNPEKASIVISHVSMSRMHAELVIYSKTVFRIKDLNTVNGTYLNTTKINGEVEAEIRDDDTLFFGENPRQYKVLKEPPVTASAVEDMSARFEKEHSKNDKISPKPSLAIENPSDIKTVDRTTPSLSSPSISSTSIITPNMSLPSSANVTHFRNMSLVVGNASDSGVNYSSSKLLSSSASSCSDTNSSSSVSRKSGFKSKWDIPVSAPLPPNLSPEDIAKCLKERAQQNAILIEKKKELTLASGLTKQQKRKLLWGRKDNNNIDGNSMSITTCDASIDADSTYHDIGGIGLGSNNSEMGDEKGDVIDEDPNLYGESFQQDSRKKTKFLKLMGHKTAEAKGKLDSYANVQNCTIIDGDILNTTNVLDRVNHIGTNNNYICNDDSSCEGKNSNKSMTWKSRDHLDASKNAQREKELEMQFLRSIKRMDGRKTGLGL